MDQITKWMYLKRSSYHNNKISRLHCSHRIFQNIIGKSFTIKYNIWSNLSATIFMSVTFDIFLPGNILTTFSTVTVIQASVEMNALFTASLFIKAIDILSNDMGIIFLFHFRHFLMNHIWLSIRMV